MYDRSKEESNMASIKINQLEDSNNIFVLMHKNVEVCQIEFEGKGEIKNVNVFVGSEAHMPIGSNKDIHSFREWWSNRAIPKTRNNVKTALEKLGYDNTSEALINNLGLSLTDCYWIKPALQDVKWEDINLFTNDFEDIFGDLTINGDRKVNVREKTNFNSATSPGELQKKWCIDKDRKRFLIKGNYDLSYQQSLNEVFASQLHKKLGFNNYVEYQLTDLTLNNGKKGIGCSSYNFCNEYAEAISLSSIYNLEKKRNHESNFEHLRNACIKIGISPKEFDDYFDYLILSDFLLTNVDRHLNNISILRDPDTLKVNGFSPIYDTGNSMGYKMSIDEINELDIYNIRVSSIENREIKMLKHVKNRNIIDLNKIDPDFSIYDNDIKENKPRKQLYIDLFNRKKELLMSFQKGSNIWKQ